MKTPLLSQKFLVITLLFSLGLVGCGNLSRSKAKSLVFEKLNADKHRKDLVESYHVSTFDGNIRIENDEELAIAKMLESSGYVTVVKGPERYSYSHIELQPKIQPFVYIDGGLTQDVWIKMATLQDVTITGINGEGNYRSVEFIRNYTLTEVGRAISYSKELNVKDEMSFSKYDDGWR